MVSFEHAPPDADQERTSMEPHPASYLISLRLPALAETRGRTLIDETWSEGVVWEQSVPWERKRVAGG